MHSKIILVMYLLYGTESGGSNTPNEMNPFISRVTDMSIMSSVSSPALSTFGRLAYVEPR